MYANTGNNKILNPRHEADELPLLTNPFLMAQAFCLKRYTHFMYRDICRLKVAGRKVPKSVLLIIQREIKSLKQTCKPDKQNSFEQAELHYQPTIYFGSTHKPTNNESFTVVDSHLFGINCKVKATHELTRKSNPFDSERGDTEPNSRRQHAIGKEE